MIKVVNCDTHALVEINKKRFSDTNVRELAQSKGIITAYYPLNGGAVAHYKGGLVLGFSKMTKSQKPDLAEHHNELLSLLNQARAEGDEVTNDIATEWQCDLEEAFLNGHISDDLEKAIREFHLEVISKEIPEIPAEAPQVEIKEIQGGIIAQANKEPLPLHFKAERHPDGTPSMIITDTFSGATTDVPLFAYREVRKALNDLFGSNL